VDYPDDLLAEGEQVVVHARPHWKTLVGPVSAFLVTVGVTIYLAGLIGDDTWAGWGWIVLGVLVVAAVVWLIVVPVLRRYTTHFVVTDRRVLVREGIIARQGIDLPKSRIEGVVFVQTFVERLLGCGTLTIETAASEPLEFEDLPNVQRVYGLLYTDSRDE
jgi:uncharacterized membrane protein YdbT with pleckstrin-like domain